MHQINSNTVPNFFFEKNYKAHLQLRNLAGTNFSIPPFKLNKSKYSNRYRKKATKDQHL